jgi:SynChlorMet cassette radical SAM/SPASM protein ScmF
LHPPHAPDQIHYEKQNRDNVPVDVMEQVVEEALPLGLSSIKFTGGEPFLNPMFFEYLERFSKWDLTFSIETNGTLLDSKSARKLKDYNIRHISVSLDGSNAQTHENIRRVRGSFNRALRGIQSLTENDLFPQVIFCLQKSNAHDLENTIHLAREMEIKSFEINPVILSTNNASRKNGSESLTIEEILALEMRIEHQYSEKYPNIHIDLYIPPAFKGIKELSQHALCGCNIFTICGILSNGDVSVCGIGRQKKELVMGNVQTDSIARIWREGKIFKEIREKIPNHMEGICGRCLFKYHCLGFCRADVMGDDQDLMDPYQLCQTAHRKGLFPEARILDSQTIRQIEQK